VSAARTDRPDALVVIDAPDLNFRLAPRIRRLGIPVVYYIAPQSGLAPRSVDDHAHVRGPDARHLPVRGGDLPGSRHSRRVVGHPLVDLVRPAVGRDEFLSAHGLRPAAPTVAILPGSRPNEVQRILPDLVAAADRIRALVPGVQFVVARAPRLENGLFDSVRADPSMVVVDGETDTVLASADVALTASGTATVQTALHDVPMVVVYRMSWLTYHLARRLVRVDAIGMVNLIAGEPIVPELVQDAFTRRRWHAKRSRC